MNKVANGKYKENPPNKYDEIFIELNSIKTNQIGALYTTKKIFTSHMNFVQR